MGKYDPLTRYLVDCRTVEVPMSFREIEQVLGVPLPPSKRYAAWWSNNPSNNVMTKAWLAAGFVTERVDPGGERLVFRRRNPADSSKTEPSEESVTSSRSLGFLDRVRRRLAGTVTIPEGVDLTQPTGESWDAEL